MKKLLLIFLFGLTLMMIGLSRLHAQCSGGTGAGALSPAPSAAFQTMSVTAGNYYTFVVPAGCIPSYDFSFCAADGGSASYDTQLTLLDNSGAYAGGYNDDNCGLQSKISGWTPAAAGTYRILVNNYPCGGTGGAATLAYRSITPPNMTFTSCTTTQPNTGTVAKCDVDQEVIAVQVVTAGTCSALSATQFQINMTGSSIPGTNTNDVTRIHIYYTGLSSLFSASSEFLNGGVVPATGTITINGSQTLQAGTNYFWIAYDINSVSATVTNVIDAQCTQLTVAAVTHVPTATNPAGTRSIVACPAYPGAGSPNMKLWLKSNSGVTTAGPSVTLWNDNSGAGVTGNFGVQPGAPAQSSPTYVANSINYNPYISFNGTTNSLSGANNFAGNSLFNANTNTIFMVQNLKAGTVYFKWETIGTGAYRVGFERNGNSMRFDFVDDVNGKNDVSTTNVINKDVLVDVTSDATNSVVKLNGNTDATKNISAAGAFNPGVGTHRIAIGNNDLTTNNLPAQIDMAEIMSYNTKLATSQIKMVESYLGIKYGITLGNNQGTGSCIIYKNSAGTSVWNNQTGFHNNVTGIGRDDGSTLDQRTSRGILSLNASLDLVTIVNGTFAAPVAFTSNLSTLLVGNNNTSAQSIYGDPTFTDYPASLGANAARIQRVWKAQATNFTQNVSIGFESTMLVGWSPVSNLRLLVDDDGNFSNGGTTIYSGAVLNGSRIEFSGVTNLGNAGNLYFSLATINYTATPLPVVMMNFSGNCENNFVNLAWTTASETNNHFFTLERSIDGINFESVVTIPGHGTSSQVHAYAWVDENSVSSVAYYRLKQTDYNGSTEVLGIISVESCGNPTTVLLYPNPTDGNAYLSFSLGNDAEVYAEVDDAMGRKVFLVTEQKTFAKGNYQLPVSLGDEAKGMYLLRFAINGNYTLYRIVKE
ncbi:MAG: T9SS type A sorting domain-containing protein [Bacteroidetes bacterium]|nr:T9SS type A sorting domain-containing protein [Bacteroidota bacterium]